MNQPLINVSLHTSRKFDREYRNALLDARSFLSRDRCDKFIDARSMSFFFPAKQLNCVTMEKDRDAIAIRDKSRELVKSAIKWRGNKSGRAAARGSN